eukprot:TRINITY_DN3950_c2_g1_i1.p1 TRINITY_DN3950_c2_g1~~TRINITY_DN3950_c2_g1_i1.p1  ORF type:complete len:439 (+),score=122.71 TRINITY_DN3950_c2_g1_i1:111-1427(+)
MSEVAMPVLAGGAPPRGVFRRRAHLWKQLSEQQPAKHSAPLPPRGIGRGCTPARALQHVSRVLAPPPQRLEVLPEEQSGPKLARLKGLPGADRDVEVPEEEEAVVDPPPAVLVKIPVEEIAVHEGAAERGVKMYVGMYSDLYEDDGSAFETPDLELCFAAKFPTGLKANRARRLAEAGLTARAPCGWITTGDAKVDAAAAAPVSEHFSARFPSGPQHGVAFAAKRDQRRAAKWAAPLPIAAPSWIIPADSQRKAAAAMTPAALFTDKFPRGLSASTAFIEETAARKAAKKASDARFWESVPGVGQPLGMLGAYRQTETMLENGTLSAHIDGMLKELDTPKHSCEHDGMMCSCSAFESMGIEHKPVRNRTPLNFGVNALVSVCFATRFPLGTSSQQRKAERVAAARKIQGLWRMKDAKAELQRLKDLEAFFAQEIENAF